MPKLILPQRLEQVLEAIRRRGGMRKVLWGLVGAGAVWFGGWLVNKYADNVLSRLWEKYWDWAADLFWLTVHASVGVVLLSFIVALAVILTAFILIALIDTSPNAEKLGQWLSGKWKWKRKKRRIGLEERADVQAIRTAWERHGLAAVEGLQTVLHSATFNEKQRLYWVYLTAPFRDGLAATLRTMIAVLGEEGTATLQEVQFAFNRLYGYYLKICGVLARMEAAGDLPDEHTQRYLLRWREHHHAFRDKLEDLVTDPQHKGQLAIFLVHSEVALSHFMYLAENRPALPLGPDSAEPPRKEGGA
jgi:hypothetical protein